MTTIDLSKDDYHIFGEMGGGAPEAHQPVEADDTLSSRQTTKILVLLGEGEIDSVVNVYLNRTPISNYEGASYVVRTGLPSQTAIPGFGEIESSASGFSPTNLLANQEFSRSFAYEVSAVRLTLSVAALRTIKDNGDVVGNDATLQIDTKTDPGAIFLPYKTTIKRGKASSPYAWDVRVARPAGAIPGQQWSVAVTRITPDDPDSKSQSATSIVGITELQHPATPYTYNNSALIAITLDDADRFGGRMPEVTFEVKGEKVYLPNNYNPVTRIYTGNWSGAFASTKQYSNNPAWCLYHVLTQRMGISANDIDLGSIYDAAVYSDNTMPDGDGGTEPRYTVNNSFKVREGVGKFLMYLLTLMNANFTSNEFGQVALAIDKPGAVVSHIVTNSNVVEGIFNYSSNALDNRFTQVNVTYNEPTLLGDTQLTSFSADQTLIDRYGLQPSDVVLVGCTSEMQALRKARWVVWTNSYDTELISFSKGIEGAIFQVGQLVNILDRDNSGFDHQGNISAVTTNGVTMTITLDRPITLTTGAHTLQYLTPVTGGTTTINIAQSNGTFSVVTATDGAGANPVAGTPFIIASATQKPITARVASIARNGDAYDITCIKHDEGKYAYVDGQTTKTPRPSQYLNTAILTCTPPFNVLASEIYASNGVTKTRALHISWAWTKGTQNFNPTYTLLWRRDKQNFKVITALKNKNYDILTPAPGQYEIYVMAVNPISNIKSVASTAYIYNYRTAAAVSTLNAVTSVYVVGTNGLTFSTADLNLQIDHNTANDNQTDKLRDYIVEVWSADGLTKVYSEVVAHNTTNGALFIFPLTQNQDSFGGLGVRTFQVKIYCRDLMGDLSPAKVVTVTNPVPGVCSFSIISGVDTSYVSISPPADVDVKGFIIWRSTSPNVDAQPSNEVYRGASTAITLPGLGGTTYYYKVAAYDSFGDIGLNVSGEQSSTTLTTNAIEWLILSGLEFKQNDPTTNTLSWTAGTITKINGATATDYAITAGSVAYSGSKLYIYFQGSGTTLGTTTSLATAVGFGGWVIASYNGGTQFKGGSGEAFTDGSTILAGTVGANQLVAGSAVITGTAQIADSIITNAKIATATITAAKIADATITAAKIGTAQINSTHIQTAAIGSAEIATAAITSTKIQDAAITNAKIGALAVDTLKIKGQAVTIPVSGYLAKDVQASVTKWKDIITLKITSTGAPISVMYTLQTLNITARLTDAGLLFIWAGDARLVRDNTVLVQNTLMTPFSGVIKDSPGAGVHTYKLQGHFNTYANSFGLSACKWLKGSGIFAIEVKR